MTALPNQYAAWQIAARQFTAGQFAAWSLLLFALAACPAVLPAATFPRSDLEQASADESVAPANAATDGQDAETFDACDWKLEGEPLQEQVQEVVRDLSCHTYRWFDGLWGDRHDFDERAVSGLLTLGAEYTEYEGFDPKLRFKVRAPLPNMSSRWDLMLGRVDEESFVSDTTGQDRTFFNPGVIDRGQDASWLLGLGHRGKERKSGLDYSLGVRLRVPPNPYGKVQYYFNYDFSERIDLRFRQTFFWRLDEGFGTTSRGDLAYAINLQNVLRWEGIATAHDETRGTQWYFGQTWYHLFEGSNAISLRAFVRGETNAPVELQEYGLHLNWRRPFTRDWLYLSVGPSITWPRELEEEERDLSLGFHVWLEMEFGDWRW
ncbi:MAG: hypothetical protein MUE63_07310 [Xanthomonadales bacterium]|jgi:hypothetical protein|nr:hypothetical protein [Xanthomonadales bacterium]